MEVVIANSSHSIYAHIICENINQAAQKRGTGIAKRKPDYIMSKIEQGDAVIALDGDEFAGFCYIESWSHGKFVANSGLIVAPNYRNQGLAKLIKHKIFEHSKAKYPEAKIFSISTGLAVLKMNSELGYKPVTFSELTDDPAFWNGCQTCKNYDILQRTEQKMCLCTGMLYNPNSNTNPPQKQKPFDKKVWERLKNFKQSIFLKKKKQ